jgi:hypothetical protein
MRGPQGRKNVEADAAAHRQRIDAKKARKQAKPAPPAAGAPTVTKPNPYLKMLERLDRDNRRHGPPQSPQDAPPRSGTA